MAGAVAVERRSRVVAVTVLLALLVAAIPPTPASARVCADVVFLPHVGFACPLDGGVYEVLAADGSSLGTTHGPDPAGPDPPIGLLAARAPRCVGAGEAYAAVVVYARAADDADGYAGALATIRGLVANANGLVHDAAVATGGSADLRVRCSDGVVAVANEVLPTPLASTTFSTIVADLRAKGYTDGTVKYWVWFDQNTCSCGIGHVYTDDSPAASNLNNGNAGSMFAVTFGVASTRVWTHEYTHNMGGVQNSAPHGTGALHCTDGRDTMCYNDGGPNGGNYTTSACATEAYDCGKDDYFHRAPLAGSYLATKWNVGNVVNRFIAFGVPSIDLLTCESAVVGVAAACSFRATDDSPGVSYTVDWGDGAATTRVPAAGTVAPGTTQSASHAWSSSGPKTVRVTATDDATPPNTSPAATTTATVTDGPLMRALACPATAETGRDATCTFRADDDSPGIFYTVDWGDGTPTTRVPASGTVAPGTTQSASHAYTATGTKTVRVTATDTGTPARTSPALTTTVRALGTPVVQTLACPATRAVGLAATCTFTATDADSTGVRYAVDWGDGTSTSVPTTGHAPPGSARSASHAYAAVGTYTVTVVATDNGSPPVASAPRAAAIDVVVDATPPVVALVDPAPGKAYVGCTATAPTNAAAPPVYVARGCVRATVTDAASGVAAVTVRLGGVVVATASAPTSGDAWALDFPVTGTGPKDLVVTAVDGSGNAAATASLSVLVVAPS